MGRFLMYFAIGALGLFVLMATFVLDHGGGSTAQIQTVEIKVLTANPRPNIGHTLTTTGTLRFDQVHDSYSVADDNGNSILISNYAGSQPIGGFAGQRVHVTGQFGFDETTGAYINAYLIAPE